MWAVWLRRPSVSVAFLESVMPLPAEDSSRMRAVRRKRSSSAIDYRPGSVALAKRVAANNSESVRIDGAVCTRRASGRDRTQPDGSRYQTRQADCFAIGAPGLHEKAFWNSGIFTTTPLTRIFGGECVSVWTC